jgi:AraC-like DNA-binding protein
MGRGADDESSHTLLVAWLQGVLVFAMGYGIAPEELTRRANIPLAELVDRDRRVPRSWGTEITRALKELLPDLALGIETGLFWSLDRIGYLGELVRHSSSIREALEKSLRVLPLIDTSILDEMPYVRTAGSEVALVMSYGKQEFWEEWVESLAFSSVQQVRALTEEPIVPLRACFTYDRESLRSRYEEHFRCPVHFSSSENAVYFERELLDRSIKGAKPELSANLAQYADRALLELGEADLIGRVRRALSAELERGELSSERVARSLSMSTRTLQRKLEAAGTSFRALADAARHEAALKLLRKSELAVYEVALTLGYRDVSSFVHAFRRWTGQTPSAYRKQPEN